MKKMLITGGTQFVSRFAAKYFSDKYDVFVLNRNTRTQPDGVTLIEADRHDLRDCLRNKYFDVVLDITAYDAQDILDLLDGIESFGDYILISSSAVYPETEKQPFCEETTLGPNCIWGAYGTNKIAAEISLKERVPGAYILRPPYLYGPGNNVYREAFVFDCAIANRPFFLPGKGDMGLQFFHVEDLCRFIECLLKEHPSQHIFNVGNRESISIREWVSQCYEVVGKQPVFVCVNEEIQQRDFFPFYNYEYHLDVEKQFAIMPKVKAMDEGLMEAFSWYNTHQNEVNKKPLIAYIDRTFCTY